MADWARRLAMGAFVVAGLAWMVAAITAYEEAKADTRVLRLHSSAMEGDTRELMKLVLTDGDIESRTKDGTTLLMSAAWQGRAEAVRFLLNHGADLHAVDEHGRTALMWVAEAGPPLCGPEHLVVARELLKRGARREQRDRFGMTAADRAKLSGHTALVEILKPPGGR